MIIPPIKSNRRNLSLIIQRIFFPALMVCLGSAAAVANADSAKAQAKSPQVASQKTEVAVFAAGCFWCIQPPFDQFLGKGVESVKVGYAGGNTSNPTYNEVSKGGTGHREVVEVVFTPEKISYEELLKVFWRNIDPFDGKGQFCDKGEQYTSAIYFTNEGQKIKAEDSLVDWKRLHPSAGEIATKVLPLNAFFTAEEYHQSYYKKNPVRYKYYRFQCGRDNRLKELTSQREGSVRGKAKKASTGS